MYSKSKLDIDKHVEECLKRINNETERNLRCLYFAKQYFKIDRYEEARRYITTYLSVRPNSAEAHNLLGKTLEKLGKKGAALHAYTTSLRLDSKQDNLVIKVCELMASDDVEFDLSGAKYFCDMAQSTDLKNNEAIFKLKQRIITSQRDDFQDVTNLFLKELETRPTDVKLRIRLLKHLLQYNMVQEAYKHVVDIHSKNLYIFNSHLEWYETAAEVLIKYQRTATTQNTLGWEFWFLSISILDKLAGLSLEEHSNNIKPSTEYIKPLFNFDQSLYTALLNINDCPDKYLIQEFINHYRGQLCFYLATLSFKQAQKDLMKFKDAISLSLPLLFIAFHTTPADLQSVWYTHAPEDRRILVRKWHNEASFRCSQSGHILMSLANDRKNILLEKAKQNSIGMWREHLYKKLFCTRSQQLKMKSSAFLTDQKLIDITIRLPDAQDLLKYDEEAQLIYPDSLHHHIWIVLNNKLSDIKCIVFDGLQYSIKQLKNCGAETLNILDIQAFIYCVATCTKVNQETMKQISFFNTERPAVLPAAIMQEMCTPNQSIFFKAAYKMYKNEYDSGVDQLRLSIVDCLRLIRCVDHGLHIKLIIMLATTFASRAKKLTKQSEIDFCEARAEMYWNSALNILEKLKNNQAVAYPPNKLFSYPTKDKDLTQNEISAHIETGKLFTATQLMKRKEYERAMKIFETIKDPYASFYQAQIYKIMADQQTSQNSKENVTSEMRSQNIISLTRARDCLYLTLDRLREPSVDQKHPLNAQLGTEIEKIERLLSRIDPDCTNRNECDGMSDENVSLPDSEHYVTGYNGSSLSYVNGLPPYSRTDHQQNHSTPYRSDIFRREARPSPERLDAQLRQLTSSRDQTMTQLHEELRSIKDAVNNLTISMKQSMTDLKSSVDDLHFKNTNDMFFEIKKEFFEIKKDLADLKKDKPSQLSEEDIYGLTSDYSTDYNINAAANLAYNSNLYPNYQARMAPTAAAPTPVPGAASLYGAPTIYPGIYPAMPYPYGLPQAFGSDQQIAAAAAGISGQDFRAISAALSQVQQTVSYGQPLTQTGLLTGPGLQQHQQQPQSTSFGNISTSTPSAPLIKAPPVNIVITSSDPLPTTKITTSQPQLSVTIPREHLKGLASTTSNNTMNTSNKAHNYQIPLPTSTIATTSPSVLSKPPPAISTQSLLSNVAPPVYSAVSNTQPPMNVSLGLSIEKTLDNSFGMLNKTNESVDEHDPIPEFKPIIPLPDEVPVTTGEEDEKVLFCERAKMYRFVLNNNVGEWRERGAGNLKILQSKKEPNKIRILMRRDQVHKICANHFITSDMNLTAMSQNNNAYIWAAHDFADEEMVVEKLCVKFKSADEAQKFYNAFEDAKKLISVAPVAASNKNLEKKVEKKDEIKFQPSPQQPQKMGGFVFSSTPTFQSPQTPSVASQPIQQPSVPIETKQDNQSPFASFSFGAKSDGTPSKTSLFADFKPVAAPTKANDDETSEDFVPTAEFAPVIPLPELIQVKTGEENCETLFESHAKLLRFEVSGDTKEWKERGVGVMKLLKDKTTVRLLMRRDQVHKICCNHQLLKNQEFKKISTNTKALTWCCKDFSEGVVKAETFAIRFKNEELANQFLQAITNAQKLLGDDNMIDSGDSSGKHQEKHMKPSIEPKSPLLSTTGFGDKFKPVKGSWNCKNCYIVNDLKHNYCVACETPKNDSIPSKTEQNSNSGAAFSFGVSNMKEVSTSWGNAFKPKEGSWECKSCYTRNDGDKLKCLACEVAKEGAVTTTSSPAVPKGVNLDTGGLKFSFGVPSQSEGKPKMESAGGWGDAFKPKAWSWECKQCYVTNTPEAIYCVACDNPKDESIPKKEPTIQGVNLDTGGQKFTFGMQGTAATPSAAKTTTSSATAPTSGGTAKATFTFGESSLSKTPFSFGTGKIETESKPGFNFKPTAVVSSLATSTTDNNDENNSSSQFIFGSPQKHDFEFVPRSPRTSTGQKDDESDNSYLEEESDNIYFKPVIPLPDVVAVVTGEEEEEVLYCHRAKLFRFTAGEWKERGLGDIKILKRKDNGKLRVVMRREQVLKICLNHLLNDDLKYLPKGDNAWLFCVPDFSEGELANEQFCVRFKNAEIAAEFMTYVKNALAGKPSVSTVVTPKKEDSTATDKNSNSDDDVIFVSETKVTPEEEKEAIKYGLPPKFMAYRQLPDCCCIQCKKDDAYYNDKSLNKTLKKIIKTNASNETPPSETKTGESVFTFSTPPVTSVSTGSVFFTPKESFTPSPQPTSSPSLLKNTDSLKGLLSKPSLLATPTITAGAASTPTFSLGGSSNIFGTPSNIFGNKQSTPTIQSTTASSATTASPFSFTNKSTPTFATETKSIFGGTTGALSSSGSLFGGTATPVTKSIFGGSAVTTSQSTPLFGSIFGQAASTTTPVFGNTSLFGSAAAAKTDSSPSLFKSSSGSLFDKPNVGSETTSIFGNVAAKEDKSNQAKDTSVELKEGDAPVLDCKTGLSFASLAQKSDTPPVFKTGTEDKTKTPFAFLGAGAPVFGSGSKDKNKSGADDGEDESKNDDEEYDPHYEPIVPLPDAIVVSTGEEEETSVFNERAKLFRFDAAGKEWKERGVGQMKILFHPINKTYRFLLRREQVHKVVLNQLIVPDLEIQAMSTSDKAWMWAGYNYTDDVQEIEKLAVRFKNCDVAQNFFKTVQEVLIKVKEIQADKEASVGMIPTSIQNLGVEDISGDEQQGGGGGDGTQSHEEEDDDEDDDDDDRSVMFIVRCTLSEEVNGQWKDVCTGDLQVYYDPDLYGARICVNNDSGLIESNTIIAINTKMEIDKNCCTWRAVEWAHDEPKWRNLKATFSNNTIAEEFHCNYIEGMNYAQEFDIFDEIPDVSEEEEETENN